MNRIRHLIRRVVAAVMLAASAPFFTSCIWIIDKDVENTPSDYGDEKDDSFQIRFQMCTRTIDSSRASEANPDLAGNEEGSGAENIINLKDIRYYIFSNDGKFLIDLTPDIDEQRSFAITKDYSLYEVVATIDDSQTDYFKKNKAGTIDFYLMAIANYSSKSGYYDVDLQYLSNSDNLKDLTLDNMFSVSATPVINSLPDTEKLMNAAADTGAENKNYFPMSGLQRFVVSGSWFETQIGDMPIDLTFLTGKSLNMLRAVAKLEIIDKINIKPDATYDDKKDAGDIRIQDASIDGVMKTARLIPSINQWKRNSTFETQQVENASVTGSGDYLLPPPLGADGSVSATEAATGTPYSLKFVYDPVETEKRTDHCPVYSCYVWEYVYQEGIPQDKSPYLSVTVRNPASQDAGSVVSGVTIPESTTYHVRLMSDKTPSAENPASEQSILRNHIYRYEISGVAAGISINWTVCPMDEASTDITFN